MTLKSGNHFSAKKDKSGEYTCSTCGGESFDYELFEAYGDEVGCLAMAGVGTDPKKLNENIDVERARQHIESLKNALANTGEATEEVTDAFEELMSAGGEVVAHRTGTGFASSIVPIVVRGPSGGGTSIMVDYDYGTFEEDYGPEPSKPSLYEEGGGVSPEINYDYDYQFIPEMAKPEMRVKKGSWLDRLMKRGA